ncbi:MAG: tetratricopeptide repeat protein [Desulfobacterales bacterium]|nr:tetratricopeptide repeat protein [Desulfobacterales bacterium]
MHRVINSCCSLITLLLICLCFPLTLPAQQSALNYFVDGVEAYDMADYEEAIRSLEKAIELKPSNLEFQYYLGLTYSAMGRGEDALKVFDSIVREEPVKFQKAYFEIAALYSKQKEYQKALNTLSLVEKISPGDSRIYLEKGYAYKNLQDYDRATGSFNKAKDLDPGLAQVVYYNIGAIYFETEQFDRAEDVFKKAIEVDPETATAENARQSITNVRSAKKARKPWYLSASFTWGYDDNVFFQALEAADIVREGRVLDKGDEFQTFLLAGGYKFINRKDLEVGAGYTLYCTGYEELTDNNLLGHIPYIYLQYNEHPVYFRVQYDFSYYYAGGRRNGQDKGFYLTFGDSSDDTMRMHSIMPTITIVEPYDLRSEITLNYQDKEYLDGITPDACHYSGGIVQSYKLPNSERYPRVGYKYGYEDASPEESSYQYHEALMGFSSPISWGVRGDASLTYARTYYHRNPDVVADGKRRDKKYMFAISLTRPLSERFQVLFSYNYTHNNSNVSDNEIDPYKFRKNVYTLSVTGMF